MVHVGGFRLRVTRRAVADVRCRPSCESCLCVSPLFRPSPFRCAISWRPSDVRPQFLVPYDLSRYWHAGRSVPIAPERGPFRVTTAQLYSDVSLVRHKTKRFTVQLRCVRQFAACRAFRHYYGRGASVTIPKGLFWLRKCRLASCLFVLRSFASWVRLGRHAEIR